MILRRSLVQRFFITVSPCHPVTASIVPSLLFLVFSILLSVLAWGQGTAEFPPEFREKVIYYDPGYDFLPYHIGGEPLKLVQYFTARGFEPKDAQQLAQWMKDKIERGAYGTVCVIGMGAIPSSILWEGLNANLKGKSRLQLEYVAQRKPTLFRNYLEAGGRLIWTSKGCLAVYQGADGPIQEIEPRYEAQKWLADIEMHPAYHGHEVYPDHQPHAQLPTVDGQRWGLKQNYYAALGILAKSVTVVLSGDAQYGTANFFLKTLNPRYPGSGLLGLPTPFEGSRPEELADCYRLALYAGKPVIVPTIPEPKVEPVAFNLSVNVRDNKGRVRSAVTREETVTLQATASNETKGPFVGFLDIIVEDSSKQTVLKREHRIELPLGTKKTVEEVWSVKQMATGDYHVVVRLIDESTRKIVGDRTVPLMIRSTPQQFGVVIAPQMSIPDNPLRRQRLVESLGKHGLAANLTQYSAELADLLLDQEVPFMVRLECGVNLFDPSRPKRLGAKGEAYYDWSTGKHQADVFDPSIIEEVGKGIAKQVESVAGHPGLLPYAVGFDDWPAFVGWNWAPQVTDRFKKWSGLEAPVPASIAASHPRYGFHNAYCVPEKRGLIDARHPWLLWNFFTADQYMGEGIAGYVRHVREVVPEMQVGMLSGSIHFSPKEGFYPPMTFGKDRFSLISYYQYLFLREPQFRHAYWLELGRAGNRDLSSFFMPEMYSSVSEIPAMIRLGVFAGLAGGAKVISHFMWPGELEARQELFRLGEKLAPYRELLGSLKPANRTVGLLVPFSNTVFDGDYALYHCATVYENLLGAHLDVEPVVEEEVLSGYVHPKRYKTILLSKVEWLRADVAKKLEEYIRSGGTVLLDRMCAVEIRGAKRLALDLVFGVTEPVTTEQKNYGTENWKTDKYFGWDYSCCAFPCDVPKPYGNPKMLAALRKTLYPFAEPKVQTPSDDLIIRSFAGAGVEYLWLLNVESAEEHERLRKRMDMRNFYNKGFWDQWDTVIQWLRQQEGDGLFRTQITLPADGCFVYDVLAGKSLPVKRVGSRVVVPVTMQRWGGTLLALLDQPLQAIQVTGPREMRPNQPATFSITILGPTKGLIPVEVKVISPRGEEREYSRSLVVNRRAVFTITPAMNDRPGKWTLHVKELCSGKTAVVDTSLKQS